MSFHFIKITTNKCGILQAGSESAPRAQSQGLGLVGMEQGCWDEGKDKQEPRNGLKQPDGHGHFHPILGKSWDTEGHCKHPTHSTPTTNIP